MNIKVAVLSLGIFIPSLVLSVSLRPEVAAMNPIEAVPALPASLKVEVASVWAESFQECLANGCSAKECSAASHLGDTCSQWRCVKGCLNRNGISGMCHTQEDEEGCKSVVRQCDASCR